MREKECNRMRKECKRMEKECKRMEKGVYQPAWTLVVTIVVIFAIFVNFWLSRRIGERSYWIEQNLIVN